MVLDLKTAGTTLECAVNKTRLSKPKVQNVKTAFGPSRVFTSTT